MLTLKIFVMLVTVGVILAFFYALFLVTLSIIFDNETCRKCTLKDRCFRGASKGAGPLCSTSRKLYRDNF